MLANARASAVGMETSPLFRAALSAAMVFAGVCRKVKLLLTWHLQVSLLWMRDGLSCRLPCCYGLKGS